MSIESLAYDMVLGEAWRRSGPTQWIKEIPDHVDLVPGWVEFIWAGF
jgi:hypothetical protein